MATPTAIEQSGRLPLAVLAAALLFNLGQGVLRPSMPLYLQGTFAANYRMVTLIPVVFGAGKWIVTLPTGYLLNRLGGSLMICGLALIALIDVASIATSDYNVFLGLRALGGVGWAMFATVATTAVVTVSTAQRRGRAVSVFLMSETCGLLIGSAAGGWLYQGVGVSSPFLFEAGCMLVAAAVVARWAAYSRARPVAPPRSRDRTLLRSALRTPPVALMGVTSAVLVAIQTGVLVFLFPLFLVTRAGVGPGAVGFLVGLSVLGRLIALWLGGSLSDRWGRMRVLIPGLLVYAVCLGSMPWLTHPVSVGLVSCAMGAAAGFVSAIPTALAGDTVEPSLQGVTIAWIRMMSDSGQIVGPVVMGGLADAIGLAAPFLLGAVLLATVAWQCWRRTNAMAAGVAAHGRRS